jgi:hypothetical protein
MSEGQHGRFASPLLLFLKFLFPACANKHRLGLNVCGRPVAVSDLTAYAT